jgi:hypothetical protein
VKTKGKKERAIKNKTEKGEKAIKNKKKDGKYMPCGLVIVPLYQINISD